jgi:hypothetical protein
MIRLVHSSHGLTFEPCLECLVHQEPGARRYCSMRRGSSLVASWSTLSNTPADVTLTLNGLCCFTLRDAIHPRRSRRMGRTDAIQWRNVMSKMGFLSLRASFAIFGGDGSF